MQDPEILRDSTHSYVRPSLKLRLAMLWEQGKLSEFYGTVAAELAPKVHRYLHFGQSGLPLEDCEDCVQQALEGFVERQEDRGSIRDPQAYIWQSAKNAARELLESQGRESQVREVIRGEQERYTKGRRKRPVHAQPAEEAGSHRGDWVAIPERSAILLTEALLEDLEVEPTWIVQVMEIILNRLRPALRRVVEHLLTYGPEYIATQAPIDLGIPSKTYRANKSKAYKELRKLIPVVMKEKGIDLHLHGIPDLGLPEVRPFPSEDEDGWGET